MYVSGIWLSEPRSFVGSYLIVVETYWKIFGGEIILSGRYTARSEQMPDCGVIDGSSVTV